MTSDSNFGSRRITASLKKKNLDSLILIFSFYFNILLYDTILATFTHLRLSDVNRFQNTPAPAPAPQPHLYKKCACVQEKTHGLFSFAKV